AIKSFFDYVSQKAPEIRIMPNLGPLYDQTQFSTVLANVKGLVNENFWSDTSPEFYARFHGMTLFDNYAKWGQAGKVAGLRMYALKGSTAELQTAFALYEILKGSNFFWIPMYTGTKLGVPPSNYQSWMDRLGNPTANYVSQPQTGQRPGYNLYSRRY